MLSTSKLFVPSPIATRICLLSEIDVFPVRKNMSAISEWTKSSIASSVCWSLALQSRSVCPYISSDADSELWCSICTFLLFDFAITLAFAPLLAPFDAPLADLHNNGSQIICVSNIDLCETRAWKFAKRYWPNPTHTVTSTHIYLNYDRVDRSFDVQHGHLLSWEFSWIVEISIGHLRINNSNKDCSIEVKC